MCRGPQEKCLGEWGHGVAWLPCAHLWLCGSAHNQKSPPERRVRPALKLEEHNQLKKKPHTFPQEAVNLAGRRKQMWLHVKAVDFD